MKRQLVPFILLFGLPLWSFAQIPHTALGLRTGQSTGISVKHYLDDAIALEGIMSFRENGLQFTALTNFYTPALSKYVSHLYCYYGLGGHAGYYSKRYWRSVDPAPEGQPEERPPLALGVDAVLGLAYEPPLFPLAFALDYKPFVDLYRFTSLKHGMTDLGFSVRYVF